MNRRTFLARTAGPLVAPFSVEAQQTAKALGLTIPPTVLARAGEVIR